MHFGEATVPHIRAIASQKLLVQKAHEPVQIHQEHRENALMCLILFLPHLSVRSSELGGIMILD